MADNGYAEEHRAMVDLLVRRGIGDRLVLEAMAQVKRHLFIPPGVRTLEDPYGDHPCEIGFGQTISQPYIVAYMIEKLHLRRGDKVLEIGSGSGYQAAVLHRMGMEVYSIEIQAGLYEHCLSVLDPSVHLRHGDGYAGWKEEAPFRGIILSCAPPGIPGELAGQLETGGRMILPAGGLFQRLLVVSREGTGIRVDRDLPVRFVPMVPQ